MPLYCCGGHGKSAAQGELTGVTEAAVAQTDVADSAAAGSALGDQVREAFRGAAPDALIVFASAQYDYETLLGALHESCRPALLVGCSSAGEFSGSTPREGTASVVALRSQDIRFAAGLARGVQADHRAAAQQLVAAFQGARRPDFRYRSALVLTDALAGHADDLVDQLNLQTAGLYQFFGGGAGDDARFQRTHVFLGRRAFTDAVVALEILSNAPIGVGVSHSWAPVGRPMRVTEAAGMRLISLNAAPAAEVYADHAEATGQRFDRAAPLPFFLHNVLGIDTGLGYRLRVPLAVHDDGAITFAAEVPVGATVVIMEASAHTPRDNASLAAAAAMRQVAGHQPRVALFFDCVATRLRLGRDFGLELDGIAQALAPAPFAGCNTYGQIVRADGQFGGFHNCTAVVCVLSD
jgi:hypothetical protein